MKKVLVADDEELIRLSLYRYLSSSGFSVDITDNGTELVKMLERGHYDTVVTDFNMPGLSAFDVLTKIREKGTSLPVIVTSADFSENIIDESMTKGAFRCISKPFLLGDILNVVREATSTSTLP